ncbi:C3a anaphylatoxin chemotactic receptor-like, partial [Oreochromis aureus]|uniref:C3a anaphylatoxin chemotactic receptor-like n=1 Tax=Oreochromis aureus TaxID=47969 RepID=UPI00195362B6
TASIVIYCVIFIVGTLGNGLVIYVTGFKMQKVWFLNLAIADFLFTAFLVFSIISLSQSHQWPFGQFMCKLNTSVVNMFASIFTLTAMSLDRYLSIWVVVCAHNKRTVCKAQLVCVGIWLVAAVFGAPYATICTVSESNGSHSCHYNFTSKESTWSLYTFRFLMGFVIPFLVILVTYVAIGIRAMRMPRTRRQRSCRIIFAIIFTFFICWLPFHVFNFIELKDNPDLRNIVRIMGPLTVSLAFLNSCLNPILYVFMCEEFMKKLQQSICFVLESALAEDHISFMSTHSMSLTLFKTFRKSDAAATSNRTNTADLKSFTESKVITEETLNTD